MFSYKTKGTCSSQILLDIGEDHVINEVIVMDGCNGNLKGIMALLKGMKAEDVISKFDGIICGRKNTSCPDQIAQALKTYIAEQG